MIMKNGIAFILTLWQAYCFAFTQEELIAASSMLEEQGRYQEAQTILEQLHTSNPTNTPITYKLACFYAATGNTERALETFKQLLATSPENTIQTLYNIGYVLKTAEHVDQAIEWYGKALALDPNYEAASFALGIAYLYKGDFQTGWKLHEKHLKRSGKNAESLRQFVQENSLAGKIILIRPDGGMGDTIQFIRYARLLKMQGAHVLAAVQPPLVPLISRCPFIDKTIAVGDKLPPCHDWCAVMSLPAVFNTTELTIPQDVPYLYPNPSLTAQWKEYIEKENTKTFKIGICWQADLHNDSSRPAFAKRGMPLKHFFDIATIPGVQLYSLQQKDGIEQLKSVPDQYSITTFDETFDKTHGAFMDTAALIPHLDLIITVDTAVAHIAGALGVRVWLLLPFCTDWRWIAGRTDSPWYPSMRIFKQKTPFDWQSVMNKVKDALKKILACKEV